MPLLNSDIYILRKKIIKEYCDLYTYLDSAIYNNILTSEEMLNHAEYFFIKMRIYICFKDFSSYMEQMDQKVISFLLKLKNTSDYLAVIYENGLAGDCDIKSVEGIEKLMIFAYNNALYRAGRNDFCAVELPF